MVVSFRHLLPIGPLVAALACASHANAEPRTALIVGNAAYSNAPLQNPVNDASDMATVLRGAGFDVILKTDADQRSILDGVRAFGDALKAKGGVGLFFFRVTGRRSAARITSFRSVRPSRAARRSGRRPSRRPKSWT